MDFMINGKSSMTGGGSRWARIAAVLCFGLLSGTATNLFAIENYTGNVVGQCVDVDNVTYSAVGTIGGGSANWYVNTLTYTFIPTPASLSFVDDPSSKIRYFKVSPGSYTVNVTNSAGPQGTYTITVPNCAKGMTWKFVAVNAPSGTVRVGCANSCNATQGDTQCTTSLPLLCIKKSGTGFPLPLPSTVNNSDQYYRWSGGVIATTAPLVPPATLAAANNVCSTQFGADWRVAEFHDGWGWAFQAYGGVGNPSDRFWVHINDQPNAICWH